MGTIEKLPIGTIVDYHGSMTHMHGQYEIIRYSDLEYTRAVLGDQFEDYYPYGIGYDLWPRGVPINMDNRNQALYNVRPDSISLVLSK